ncbi:MAG: hypothetical protein ABEJ72_10950, partial [Candidatus Aenigmatarchaeota archaeon]
SIGSLMGNKEKYLSKDVLLKDVKVVPYEEEDGGWWHEIRDGTGSIKGFSSERIEDRGDVEGYIEADGEEIYIMF